MVDVMDKTIEAPELLAGHYAMREWAFDYDHLDATVWLNPLETTGCTVYAPDGSVLQVTDPHYTPVYQMAKLKIGQLETTVFFDKKIIHTWYVPADAVETEAKKLEKKRRLVEAEERRIVRRVFSMRESLRYKATSLRYRLRAVWRLLKRLSGRPPA